MNPLPREGFPHATLRTARGKEPLRSSGEGLSVCLLGQNVSEKLQLGVRLKFLDEIQKHQL